jgi:hypothetical protein
MQTSEKTYSFRAPAELGARVRRAFELWERRLGGHGPEADIALAEYLLATLEAVRAAPPDNQSAMLRSVIKAFVASSEKVEEDVRALRRYRAWAEEDGDATAVREGALQAAAERWREE